MSFLSDLLGTSYKEGMTEEEISKAVEVAMSGNTSEMDKLKTQLSRANSEAAEYKKQLREKQTEAERKAAEQKEEWDKMVKENADLKRNASIFDTKAKLSAMGYDVELAGATATAMVDGDIATVMTNQSKFLESQKKTIEANLMRGTSRPGSGSNGNDIDYAKKIEEAQAAGEYSQMAYYTRLQAEAQAAQK